MLDGGNRARTDHEFRALLQNRAHQLGDIRRIVLVIRIGVQYHIRSEPEAIVQTSHERPSQPLIARVPDYVIHTQLFSDFRRAIRAAIIHHQPLHLVEALNLPRQFCQGDSQGFRFIITGDLDD